MKRIIYKVVQASENENQDGIFHISLPFATEKAAILHAKKFQNDFITVEKFYQVLDEFGSWEPDFSREHTSEIICQM